MPTPPASPTVPPPTTGPVVAPTPATVYNPGAHVSPNGTPARSDPALRSGLEKYASPSPGAQSPAETQRSQSRGTQPSQPPPTVPSTPPTKPPTFTSPDDAEAVVTPASTAAAESTATAAPVDPAPSTATAANSQLRAAYEKVKADFSAAAAERELTKRELSEFRSKAKAYEERIAALSTVEAQAKDLAAKNAQFDERLRILDYTQHPEFHEQYVAPVAHAVQAGYDMVRELAVTSENRLGTNADFDAVMAQPNYTLALDKASELFGERLGQSVLESVKAAKSAQRAHAKALEGAALKSSEWLQSQHQREAELRTKARTVFDAKQRELADKFPTLYRPSADDTEAAAVRTAGERLALLAIEGMPEGMSHEDYLGNMAKIYHRAAAFPMQLLKQQRLETELESLRTKLAAYEKSTPDAQGRLPGTAPTTDAGGAIIPKADSDARMRASLQRRATTGR